MKTNPNVHDEFDIAEVNEKEREIYRELNRDAGWMDVAKIEKAIQADYSAHSDDECREMLRRIHAQQLSAHSQRAKRRQRYAAMLFACVLAAGLTATGVAYSFGSRSVLQFFSSLAGISSFQSGTVNGQDIAKTQEVSGDEGVWKPEDEDTMSTFFTPEALFAQLPYYQTGLTNLFETCPFVSAYKTEDPVTARWTITAQTPDKTPLYIRLIFQYAENLSVFYAYEEDLTDHQTVWHRDIQINCVTNYDNACARWTDGRLHGSVWSDAPRSVVLDAAQTILDH